MRIHPKRVIALLLGAVTGLLLFNLFVQMFSSGYNISDLRDDVNYLHPNAINLSCRRPELDLHDPELEKFYKPNKDPIACDDESDWVCLGHGIAFVCNDTLRRHKNISCKYTFLKRVSDYSNVDGETVDGGSEPVQLMSDFFKVSCVDKNGVHWSNIMAGVRNDPQVQNRSSWEKLGPEAARLNVLMLGIGSLSRNAFMRKLPKTYAYLTDVLYSVVLKGYNTVGDGTTQALIPLLTGMTEPELPETRRRKWPKAQFVNVYPFIWKEFANWGYVTAFAEDNPSDGAFTHRLKGFDVQPTDHYLRPFYVAAEPDYSSHKKFCLRGTTRHKVMMDWVSEIFTIYSQKPKFVFAFQSELSRGDYNLLGSVDHDLLRMIKTMKDKKQLDNTVLILFSDHGRRFSDIREFQQGKQEERLPYFSFTFPGWFKTNYPHVRANLTINENRLTSPFDVYPTLRRILDMTDVNTSLSNRSINLFSEVPSSRTCRDAHINSHWCTCLTWETVANDDVTVVKAVDTIINFFNSMTQSSRKLCSSLKLQKIIWAGKFMPTADLMNFKRGTDDDGFEADSTSNQTANIELHQIMFHTTPGNGRFQVSVRYDSVKKMFRVRKEDVNRVNNYGSAANCITSPAHEHLRKFCNCKPRKNETKR